MKLPMSSRGFRPAVYSAFIASLVALAGSDARAQEWTAGGASLNWVDGGNWSIGFPPGIYDTAYFADLFSDTCYTNNPGLVNNIVSTPFAVGSLRYVAQSSGTNRHFHTTLIPASSTLTVVGNFAEPTMLVGGVTTGSATNYATITGAGSLVVSNNLGRMEVQQPARATLDLTGLNSFTAKVANLWVGATPEAAGVSGGLLLAKTNLIATVANPAAPGILLGFATNSTASGAIVLGAVNEVRTDGLVVGGNRGNAGSSGATLTFSPGLIDPTFTLRGSSGGSARAANFNVGDVSARHADYQAPLGGGAATGTADFSGGIVDIRADAINVARSAADVGTGSDSSAAAGTLVIERGTVDANQVNVAYKQGTNRSYASLGTLTLKSNATMTVNQSVRLAYRYGLTNGLVASTAVLNVNDNAILNVGGSIIHGDGGVSTINLGGGTINLTANGDVYANNLQGAGTIAGAGTITVTNSLTVGGASTAGTLNLGGNLVLKNTSPITFNLGGTNIAGGGVNDFVNVTGDVNFNSSTVVLVPGAPLLAGSNYHLIDFTGTSSGSVTLSNTTRSPLGLDQSTPGHLDLVVTNWTPATLAWNGSNTNVWNTALTNWNAGNSERFYQFDDVVFDDSGSATLLWLQGTVTPSSFTINGSKSYSITNRSTFINNGNISGFTGITKNGAGTFKLGTVNSFTGPININSGVIQVFDPTFTTPGNASILGDSNAVVNVYAGGTYDFTGIGSISSGKRFYIAGTGYNGMGALTNSVSNSGATVNGFLVTLTGDALIGAGVGGLGLRGFGSSGSFYTGLLDLGGNTLTKLGAARFSLQDVVATNSGTINFGGGTFQLQNTLLGGSGSLNLSNNTLLQFAYAAGATSYVSKAISTAGNVGLLTPASGNAVGQVLIASTVDLGNTLYVTNNQVLVMEGPISGAGGIAKYGNSNLVLNAVNTFTGPTAVSAGGVELGVGGSVATSPLLQIDAPARLDVLAKGATFATAPGQTLVLNGTAIGDVTVGSGSTLLGAGIVNGSLTVPIGAEVSLATTNVTGTLIVSNSLALAGGHFTWELAPSLDISDAIVVGGNLTLTGTNVFTINSIGGFDPSGVNTLITYSGALTGGLTNLALNTAARFTIEFIDPATTPGVIQVRLINPSPTLVWKGGAAANPTRWDVKATANWDNAGVPDIFYSSDLVTFDDTSVTNVVDLAETLGPGAVTMANNSVPYHFRGPGSLVAASLTNNGTAGLVVSNTANNFFTGVGMVLNAGAITFNQPTNTTLTGNLNGSGTFNKAGSSVLTLVGNAANFLGTANVAGGTLRAGSSNAIAGSVNVSSGSTLDVNGQLLPSAAVTVSGIGADGWGAINNRGNGRTNALESVTLVGNTTFGALSNAWGLVNNFQGAGFALTKTNTQDVWVMTGTETDLGDMDVRQGRLVFSVAGTTLGRPESNITVRANAALTFATTNAMPQSGSPPDPFDAGNKRVTLQANAAIETVGFSVNQTSTNIFSGPISITTNAVFRVGGNSRLELNGPISGANGLLILTNGGTLALYGTNTYTSNTIVHSGTLLLTSSSNLPANTTLILSNRTTTGNAALTLGNNAEFPLGNPLNISLHNAAVTVGGDGTWNGPITLGGGNNFSLFGGVDGLNLLGSIVTNGNAKVSIEGDKTRVAGLLRFTNEMSIGVSSGLGAAFDERFTTVRFDSQNFWTNTVFGRGRIILGANNALPSNAPMRLGVLSAGVGDRRLFLDLNGFNQTVSTVAETAVGDSTIRFGNSSTNANSVLTVATPPGTTNTWAIRLEDDLENQLNYTNSLGLTVTSGLLALVNTNTYTGPTLITGGTLLLNIGTGLNAGRVGQLGETVVTVSGTGTLGGNGTIAGPVTVASGGTLSAGTSIGKLTINNTLDLQAGSRSVFELNVGNTNDQVVGISTLTCGGTLVVTNVGALPFADGNVFKLFDAASYVAGTMAVQPASPGPGLAWDTSKLAMDGTLRVVSLPPAPVIAGYGKLPDGNFAVTVNGENGRFYSLLATTNVAAPLNTWTVIQSAIQISSSVVLTDLGATNYPTRFYLISTP